jgi:iron complex transport system permease protein
MSLAVCGVIMQSVMSNPLADPYTTGISSGASLGAVLALTIGFSFASMSGQYGIVSNAFVMALIPAIIVIVLSRIVYTSPATLILIGTAISYIFGSLNTILILYADEETMATAYLWRIGSFDNMMWSELMIPFAVTVVGCALALIISGKLNVMMLGDNEAKSMGLDAENFRTVLLVLISVMVAAVISYTGILGFVGLVAPHMVRMLVGSDNKYVLPASMAFGAALLLAADILARIAVHPSEIPSGIILMFIGGPMFLYLIVRKKGYGGIY